MSTDEPIAFGPVLSRYRSAAGLTQEELAERAGLSVRAISDLERGVNKSPRAYTAHQLADALQLSPDDRALFEGAARTASDVARHVDVPPEGNFLGALPAGQLVAREDELERFGAILDAVAGGVGHLVLLGGETGAGKTRLLQEMMAQARERGALVLTARCDRSEVSNPYYPFLEALTPMPSAAPEKVRAEAQRTWKRIQDMVTRDQLNGRADHSDVMAQQQLFRAISDLLTLASRSVPLVLLLDDIEWADKDSLKLLQHLAHTSHGSRIMIAATFRDSQLTEDHPPLAQMLQILSRERLAERIMVRRLSLDETTALVAATMGGPAVSEEFASFVYRRTKGNSRLIDGLVRSLGGRLELQGEIGAGSMGRVFRAFDRSTGRTVAAKVVLARTEIDLDALLRFQQEGAVLATLEHPHIVDIYDTFAEEHASCIIMELLDGLSLGHILQDGALSLDRARGMSLQVAEALAYAHGQGIVHRDIKPDNVMVLEDDQVKVTDFGIARILQPDTSLHTIATTGMRMGTPLYMAPEQIEGKKIDGRTDIYALGAMLYHMVTGRPPFEGTDALAVAVKHLQEEPRSPSSIDPTIPAHWDALILKAMAKDPKARFQSAGEMLAAIQALSVQPGTGEVPAQARRVSRLLLISVPAAVVAVAALAFVLMVFWIHPAAGQTRSALGSKLDAYLAYLTSHGRLSGTVLVARGGQVILSKGYGLADREHRVPNAPAVKYPSIANFNINLTAAVKLQEVGTLHASDRICRYLPNCPSSWKPITIRQVIDGTSGLVSINWASLPGTTAQSLNACESSGLSPTPAGSTDYENCDTIVLGTIMERVSHQPWESVIRRTVLDPAGMRDTGRLTDSLEPPARANDYNSASPVSGARYYYNPYFELYSTTPDILRYDDALFGGKLLSATDLRTLLTPRDLQPDPGIPDAHMAYMWKVGHIAGQLVFYRYGTTNLNFTGINMWFPRDGTTVIVDSNDRVNDAMPIGVNLGKLLYGGKVIFPIPLGHVRSISARRAIRATVDVQLEGIGLPAFGDHVVWLPNDNTGSVVRVSARTNQIISIDHLGIASPNAGDPLTIAANGSQVWMIRDLAREVDRIDPATGKVVERVKTGDTLADISVADGIVWGTSEQSNDVLRIDPRTHQVTHIGQKFGFPTELAADGDSVWVSSFHSATVRRINARTGRVVASIRVGTDPESIAVGYGSVWVVNGTGGYVSRIDPRTNTVVAQIGLGNDELNPPGGPCCHGVAIGQGAVWVAVHKDQSLARIDPNRNRVTSLLTLPSPPGVTSLDVWNVMVGDGSIWVHAGPHYLYRIDPTVMATG